MCLCRIFSGETKSISNHLLLGNPLVLLFYEILQDDITEGRAVYENRVPEAIRTTGDYLQEAFDNFIAAKKKLR